MAERPPYQLEEQENSRIYKDRIEPILLATVQVCGHERPRLIMLGGQPGSGKTFLLRNPAEDELAQDGGFISIDADEMRTSVCAFTAAIRKYSIVMRARAGQRPRKF
jgi:SpoVK/Ycf46/Vps4 family AAA+-type ATPase